MKTRNLSILLFLTIISQLSFAKNQKFSNDGDAPITFDINSILASDKAPQIDSVIFKHTPTRELTLKVYHPDKNVFKGKRPAIVFYFGGGWLSRNIKQFEPHADFFARRGFVAFIADYRVFKTDSTSPYQALMDAKSTIRYIRKNSDKYSVDIDKIVASGGSAGGHLAAATAMITDYNDPSDDLSISCKPNALVLFNAVVDNSIGGYGYDRIGENYHKFSPMHNLTKTSPPTILFLGDNDHLIPVVSQEYYVMIMQKLKQPCELWVYKGGKHGFFNNNNHRKNTLIRSCAFLANEGFFPEFTPAEVK